MSRTKAIITQAPMKATTMLPHQWAEPSTKKPKSRPPKNEPMSPTMIVADDAETAAFHRQAGRPASPRSGP